MKFQFYRPENISNELKNTLFTYFFGIMISVSRLNLNLKQTVHCDPRFISCVGKSTSTDVSASPVETVFIPLNNYYQEFT